MSSLLKGPKTYINGQWISAASGNTFDVKNPVNGNVIASVPDMDGVDAHVAINAAHEVSPEKKDA